MPEHAEDWPFYYENVPGLGKVIFSPDALAHLQRDRVSMFDLKPVLELGADTKAVGKPYSGVREYSGIRLEIKTRRHLPGAAAVVIDGYRVKP